MEEGNSGFGTKAAMGSCLSLCSPSPLPFHQPQSSRCLNPSLLGVWPASCEGNPDPLTTPKRVQPFLWKLEITVRVRRCSSAHPRCGERGPAVGLGGGRSESKLLSHKPLWWDWQSPVPLHQNTPADLMEQFFSLGISEAIYNIPFSQGLGA